jgi:hypothetical protein
VLYILILSNKFDLKQTIRVLHMLNDIHLNVILLNATSSDCRIISHCFFLLNGNILKTTLNVIPLHAIVLNVMAPYRQSIRSKYFSRLVDTQLFLTFCIQTNCKFGPKEFKHFLFALLKLKHY